MKNIFEISESIFWRYILIRAHKVVEDNLEWHVLTPDYTTTKPWEMKVKTFYFLFSVWRSARLKLTDELIGDLNVNTEESRDLQRIKELLEIPRNEGPAGDTEGP